MGAGQTRPTWPQRYSDMCLQWGVFPASILLGRRTVYFFFYWNTCISLEVVAQFYTGKDVWFSKGRLCSCQGLETVPGPQEMIAFIGSVTVLRPNTSSAVSCYVILETPKLELYTLCWRLACSFSVSMLVSTLSSCHSNVTSEHVPKHIILHMNFNLFFSGKFIQPGKTF